MQRNLGTAAVYSLSPRSPSAESSCHHSQKHITDSEQPSFSPIKSEPDFDYTDEEEQSSNVMPCVDGRPHYPNEPQPALSFSTNSQQQYNNGNSACGGGNSDGGSFDSESNLNGNSHALPWKTVTEHQNLYLKVRRNILYLPRRMCKLHHLRLGIRQGNWPNVTVTSATIFLHLILTVCLAMSHRYFT